MASLFLGGLGTALWGYAVFGRGFAQVGLPPLYVGESLVMLGALVLLMHRRRLAIIRSWSGRLLLVLVALAAVRATWGISLHGLDAIRDLAVIYYAAFAIVLAAVLDRRRDRWLSVVSWYRRFAILFPPLGLLVWWYTFVSGASIPTWPGSGVPLVWTKAGDTMVHASGVFAFIVVFGQRNRGWLPLQMVSLAALSIFGMSMARAGMLALFSALCVLALLRGLNWRLIASAVAVVGLVGGLLAVSGDEGLPLQGQEHSASGGQIVENVRSVGEVVSGTDLDSELAGPAVWRLLWWSTIARYSLTGEYFWWGKGFGVNLADDDGFQTEADGSLRSPHNVNMTILARMGVPGAVLWLVFHVGWAASVWRVARTRGEDTLPSQAGVVILVYWTAMMVNASFDVYVEGPMGGVWYWSLIGLGLALPRTAGLTAEGSATSADTEFSPTLQESPWLPAKS